MKFYQPETEKLILRLAREGQSAAGLAVEPPDHDAWARLKRVGATVGKHALFGFIFIQALGFFGVALRHPHWQMLFSGTALMLLAIVRGGQLRFLSFRPPSAEILLWYLPVPGTRVLRWARAEVLGAMARRVMWPILAAWCIAGFPLDIGAMPSVAVHGLLLAWMFVATTMLSRHGGVEKSKLPVAWVLICFLTGIISFWLLIMEKSIGRSGSLPAWVLEFANFASWLLPFTWVHPDRIQGWGGMMALLWGSWGLWWLWRWPASHGPTLDRAADMAGSEPAGDDSETAQEGHGGELDEASTAEITGGNVLPVDGWIERLAWRCIPAKDHWLAAAMVSPRPRWTVTWMRVVKTCLVAVLLALLLRTTGHLLPPHWVAFGMLGLWAGVVVVLMLGVWPLSNMTSRGTQPWALGNQRVPVFAALPIGARDLLRLSMRLTMVRSGAFAMVAVPFLTALAYITESPEDPLVAVRIVPVVMMMWIFSRPMFVLYHLQEHAVPKKGSMPGHLVMTALKLMLGCLWALSGVVTLMVVATAPALRNPWVLWSAVLAGVVVNGICARATFEVFYRRLRAGKMDLIRTI